LITASSCGTGQYRPAFDLNQTSDRETVPAFDPTTFWTEFRHGTVTVNGVRLHFVEGGNGEPVLLLPGWPPSWQDGDPVPEKKLA